MPLPRLLPVVLFALFMSAAPAHAQSTIVLPDFSDPSLEFLSRTDEQRLGTAVLHQLRQRRALLEDVQLAEYLNAVGQRLALHADNPPHPFSFFWVQSPRINAFAAPGGYIGVNTGLLLATRDESELAGVLAHEIAHVTQRHIARSYADMQRMRLPMAAALVASAIIASANPELGQAAITGTIAAGAQRGINFTRAHEQEADRLGVQLLARSGFDPAGMGRFFDRLAAIAGPQDALMDYLRTHPRAELRSADVTARTDLPTARPALRDALAYPLARARAEVLSERNTLRLARDLKDRLAATEGLQADAERYAMVLAYKRSGRLEEAAAELSTLLARHPDRLEFRIEQAELALARSDTQRAWDLFEDAHRLFSDDFRLTIHHAQAQTNYGDARRAVQLLEPHLRGRPRDASLHALYASAAERAGRLGDAYAALAEYHFLNGEVDTAIRQAEQALRDPAITPYQQAQIQARLRIYRDALRDSGGSG